MKKLFSTTIIVCSIITTVHAAQVTVSSAFGGRQAVDAASSVLPNGNLVLVGTFATPANITNGTFATVSANAGWSQFSASSLAISSISTNGGKITGSLTDNVETSFNGKLLYVWIFNASTTGAATQEGIFSSSTWGNFPTQAGGVGDTITYSFTSDANLVASNSVGSTSASQAKLVTIIPEPSTYALLGTGLLTAVPVLRRRKTEKSK